MYQYEKCNSSCSTCRVQSIEPACWLRRAMNQLITFLLAQKNTPKIIHDFILLICHRKLIYAISVNQLIFVLQLRGGDFDSVGL